MVEGYVYLIKAENTNDYKIGITRKDNVNDRIKQLQTGAADKLDIVYTFKSKYANLIENSLHRWFRKKRKEGEWFSLSGEDVNVIKTLCERFDRNFKILNEQNYYFNKK